MSKDPGDLEIGYVLQESYECEAITWKIPHVSSLEITSNTEIRSPQFCYENATWVLKLFPYGGRNVNGESGIITKMERLHSEIPEHNFFCSTSFKCQNHVPREACYEFIKFDTFTNEKLITPFELFPVHWNAMFFCCKSYRWEDTITLIVEILSKNTDSETNSNEADLGSKYVTNADSLQSIGHLSTESFDVSIFAWKIPGVTNDIPFEVDNKVQSPAFPFAGASWILKLFLCGQTKFNTKDVDVVIERLHSNTENHSVLYKIFFKSFVQNESLVNYYSKPFNFARGSFSFNSSHVQENVLKVMSYNGCLDNLDLQSDTLVLMCELRIGKDIDIGLNLQMESLQLFKEFSKETSGQVPMSFASTSRDSPPLVTEKLGKQEIGKIIKTPFECEVISWTIPRVSSLLAEGSGVLSPRFFYKGAVWILKIYPYGRSYPDNKGDIEVVMKRLRSEVSVHKLCYRIFFKDPCCDAFYKDKNSLIYFHSSSSEGNVLWRDSDLPNFYNTCRHNDTIVLVFELYKQRNLVNKMHHKVDLVNTDAMSDDSSKTVGELFTESIDVEIITWKVPKVHLMAAEVDYRVQSPSFSFADASWILKMYPMGRRKFETEGFKDVIIERTHSVYPKHDVSYRIYFDALKDDIDEKGYSLDDFKTSLDFHETGSFIFDSNYAQENVCYVPSYDNRSYGNILNIIQHYMLSDADVLVCDFRIKANPSVKMNLQHKSAKSSIESSQERLRKEAALVPSASKELSDKVPEPKTVPFHFPFKESSEKESEQNPGPSAFTFKESQEKVSEQSSVLHNFSFKESTMKKTEKKPVSTPTFTEILEKVYEKKSIVFNSFFKGSDYVPRESNKKFLQDLKELLQKQEDCDVILRVKGQDFSAHRLILKARSTVFASTFRNDMKEKATGVVDIEDCDPSCFPDFLHFLYCGNVENLSSENACSLFIVADKYDVQDLRSECLEFMKRNVSVDTFLDIINIACQHSERGLFESAIDFFSMNLERIIETVKWQAFLVQYPIYANELLLKALASKKQY